MSPDPSKSLEILFSIEKSVIARDLKQAEEDVAFFTEEIQSLCRMPFNVKSAGADARLAHLYLVTAYGYSQLESVAPERKLFMALGGARLVTYDVEQVSWNKDTLGKLSSLMEEIRMREGLAEDEYWMAEDAPADYRELQSEYSKVFEKIIDTAFIYALRRYKLDDIADLFENDRKEFEIQREIGRRLNCKPGVDTDVDRLLENSFRKAYGEDAVRRVERRVEELRRAPE